MKAVKGTRDILPPASQLWNQVETRVREVFRTFNYHEIRTPIFEETALFARGVGAETDIVSKEMYTFDDHGDSLTLRPENTAGVMRAYLEHRLDQRPGIQKLYYLGPMFRRERPQKGRYRQFYQIGAEAIGVDSAAVDAEMIELVDTLLKSCGVEGARLLINSVGDPASRAAYVEELRRRLANVKDQLSPDNARRAETNPLRVLDSKEAKDEAIIAALPSIHDFLNETAKQHFADVRRYLDDRGIAYEVNPRLVRGLDYYTHTTFEFLHGALGAQNAICGGGRYNGLAETIGSKLAAPGVGFSIGQDRLIMAVEDKFTPPQLDVYLAPLDDASFRHCALLAQELRGHALAVELAAPTKPRRAMELADKLKARAAVMVGDNELTAGVYAVKTMATGAQESLTREQLLATLLNHA
ncbi:MAG: histidine--tRNA ligase [Bryobacteraceae bacterium]|nr:histidine--tRNA ligase [Bryobacteraceae bacterium]